MSKRQIEEPPTPSKKVSYDKIIQSKIVDLENEYCDDAYDSYFWVMSALTGEAKRINRGALSVTHISDHFTNYGHTLGIMTSKHYYVPLILDIDHKPCKKTHTCAVKCERITEFVSGVYAKLCAIVPQLKKPDRDKNVYYETRQCGIHLYVNITVSLTLYEKLIDYLNTIFDADAYFFDSPATLPLPQQIKLNKSMYTAPESSSFKFACTWINAVSYDYEYELVENTLPEFKEILKVATITQSVGEHYDWNRRLKQQSVLYVCIKHNLQHITKSETGAWIIKRLLRSAVNTNYKYIKLFIEENAIKPQVIMNEDIKCDVPDDVIACISQVGKLIARQLKYQISDNMATQPGTVSNFNFIYMVMSGSLYEVASELTYDIYVMCSLLGYMKEKTKRSIRDLSMSLKNIFNAMSPPPSCEIFHTFNELLKYNAFEHMCQDVFLIPPLTMLQYMTMMTYYQISDTDTLNSSVNKVIAVEIDITTTHSELISKITHIIIPYFYFTLRTSKTDDVFFFNSTTIQPKNASNKKSLDTIPFNYLLNGLTSTFNRLNVKTNERLALILQIYASYIDSLTPGPVKLGQYQFFVNTQIGVFCTITGTYIRSTPFLHFKDKLQMKRYCLNFDEPEDLNQKCIAFIAKYNDIFRTYIDSIETIWFRDIFIPGILTIDDALFFTIDDCDHIIRDLMNRLDDCTHRDEICTMFELVQQHYDIKNEVEYIASLFTRIDSLNVSKSIEMQLSQIQIYTKYDAQFSFGMSSHHWKSYIAAYTYMVLSSHQLLAYNHLFIKNVERNFKKIDNLPPVHESDCRIYIVLIHVHKLFGYNTKVTVDLLRYLSLLYQPLNEHRKFLLLYGPTATGKSRFVTVLSLIHGESVCPLNGRINHSSTSETASPLLNNAATAYLTVVKEAEEISANQIKILTGHDAISVRTLYQEPSTIDPMSFIICVSNAFPRMKADNAIRDRLLIFQMDCTFLDRPRESNLLLRYLHKEYEKDEIDSQMPQTLSNLLYLSYRYFRDHTSKINFEVTNTISHELLLMFMQKRNRVYEILRDAKIYENQKYDITQKELTAALTPIITPHKITISLFLEEFNQLFPKSRHIINNRVRYRGIGVKKSMVCASNRLKCIATNSNQHIISNADIVARLHTDTKLSEMDKLHDMEVFARLYKRFYDPNTHLYNGLTFDPPL